MVTWSRMDAVVWTWTLLGLPGCMFVPDVADPFEPGGSVGCTEIGCVSGYRVEFEAPAQHTWPVGKYQIRVAVDQEHEVLCSAVIPLSCGASQDCSPQVIGGAQVFLTESGCALLPSQHQLGGVLFNGGGLGPVRVEVSHEGVEVGAGLFAPVFKTFTPNGKDCPPTCHVAPTDKLVVFSPP